MNQFLAFLTALIFPAVAFATVDSLPYLVKNYTDVDGLPQNSIKAIAIGQGGFAWLTTEDGLVRFDGHHFEDVTHSFNLLSNRFGSIIPGAGENEFFANTDKGQYIHILNARVSVDTGFVRAEKEELGFIPNIDNYLLSANAGFSKTRNGIIIHRDTSIIRSSGHIVYIIDRATVSLFRDSQLLYRLAFPHGDLDRFFLVAGQLYYLKEDLSIISFGSSGLSAIKLQGDILGHAMVPEEKRNVKLFWNSNDPSGVLLYHDRSFFSVNLGPDKAFQSRCISDDFDAEKNEIISACFDQRRQLLLLGSYINGLFVITRSLFTNHGPIAPGKDKVFYAQLALPDSTLLTSQGYLFVPGRTAPLMVFDSADGRSDKYSLVMDGKGNTWTKRGNTLYCSSHGNFRTTLQRVLPGAISQIYVGLHDRLWIGLDSGELYYIDTSDPLLKARPFARLPFAITCFAQQQENILWLGTVNGLFQLQTLDRRVDTVSGTSGKYIRSLYQVSADELWVTTYGNGFFLYRAHQLISFPLDKNNYLLTSHCILRDKKDFFWISTNKGLFQVSHRDLLSYANGSLPELHYRYYSTQDGLLTNEFNGGCQPCAVQMANGIFSFPSINGLVWFRPEDEKPVFLEDNVFIDKILVDNKKWDIAGNFSLPRDLQQMKVFLSVPYWGNPGNVHLHYALVKEGQEPVWLPVENNVIALSTIPSGNYILLVRKINGFGYENQVSKAISFRVPAPWILRPLVLAALAILLILLVYLVIQLRTRFIRQRNTLLELRIRRKTAELQQAHDELAQSQQELLHQTEWQQKMIAVFSHDIKAPMKYLMMTADRITRGLVEENNSAFIGASSVVHEHIRRLYHVMDNILQYIKTQITETVIQEQDVDMYELAQEKVNIYRELAHQMNTSLVNEVPTGFVTRSNRILLSVILHNLIDNAVKVTERGSITISGGQTTNGAALTVVDTGIGMQPALIEWINQENEARRQQAPAGYKEMGIGLLMVKDLAALLQIKMHAASSAGSTSITLSWLNS